MDDRNKIRMVTDALIRTRGIRPGPIFELEHLEDNKLKLLYRDEVIWALDQILINNRDLFMIVPLEDVENISDETKTALTRVMGETKWWEKWKALPDNPPILIGVSDDFDNWCEAQIHKRNITLRTLSEDSRQKVLTTVADIYQRFELTSSPSITLGWVAGNTTKDHEARRLALEFLENKEVVKHHQFAYTGGGHIAIEIDIKEFLKMRDEFFAYYKEVPQSAAAPSNAFTSVQGLRWQDIQLKFVDGHTVRITAKGITETVDYKEMGFEDLRAHKPNTQWALLGILAQKQGEISWEDSAAKDSIKKQKQLLSDVLQSYFGIHDDPFHPYKENKGYRIKLTLIPE